MDIVKKLRYQAGVTQQELAAKGGTSQSTIAAYETGAKSPTLRTVENLARSQNLELVVTYLPRLTREDQRSLAFHQAIVEHIGKKPAAIIERAKTSLKNLVKIHPGAKMLLDQWQTWLNLPVDELISKLLDPSPEACEMRHVSPFSGVLNPGERARILKQFRQDYQF